MNKKPIVISVVSLVVALIAVFIGFAAYDQVAAPALAGVYANQNVASGAGAGIDFGPLPVNVNWYGGKIGPKANTAFYHNVSGGPQYVDYAEISTDNIASSSFKIYGFSTTTAPRTLYDFVAPAQGATTTLLINGFTFATTTTATTTTSDDSKGGGGSFSGSTAFVPNNGYFIFQLQSLGIACVSQPNGTCDSATSTNRGFNLQWRVQVHN